MSLGTVALSFCTKRFSRSMRSTSNGRTSNCESSLENVESSVESVAKWYSSGKIWITISMRYCWAILSWHLTIWLKTRGITDVLYMLQSTPSSCDKRARFFPTSVRSSRRSASRFCFSCAGPCCNRTQSLFISVKLTKIKSMLSRTSPLILRHSEWKEWGK